ncbi:MAG: hypothetical protein D6705_13595 [Deltaproteobacteria bacterium]|nr:MAG: hypothetical protein D6705_13595 [Deltaproteobacteria bacterium]
MAPRPVPSPAIRSYWRAPPPPDRKRAQTFDPTRCLRAQDRDLWGLDRRSGPRPISDDTVRSPASTPWGLLAVAAARLGGRRVHLPVRIVARRPGGWLLGLLELDRQPPGTRNAALLAAASRHRGTLLDVVSVLAIAPRIFEDLRQLAQGNVEGAFDAEVILRDERVVKVTGAPLVDPRPGILATRFRTLPVPGRPR